MKSAVAAAAAVAQIGVPGKGWKGSRQGDPNLADFTGLTHLMDLPSGLVSAACWLSSSHGDASRSDITRNFVVSVFHPPSGKELLV